MVIIVCSTTGEGKNNKTLKEVDHWFLVNVVTAKASMSDFQLSLSFCVRRCTRQCKSSVAASKKENSSFGLPRKSAVRVFTLAFGELLKLLLSTVLSRLATPCLGWVTPTTPISVRWVKTLTNGKYNSCEI